MAEMMISSLDSKPQRGRFPRGIQGRLILLLLTVLTPTLLIQTYVYYDRFESRRAEELQANLEVARAVAKTFRLFLKDVLSEELSIGLAFASSQRLSEQDRDRVLTKGLAARPAIWHLLWLNPAGMIVAASNTDFIGTDLSDRHYFREIVAGRDWAVSNLILSRVTGQPCFTISQGFRDEKGQLIGIIVAAILPEDLDAVLYVARANGGGLTLIDGAGMLVYRQGHADYKWEDRNLLKKYPVIAEALKGKEITSTLIMTDEKERRLAGFAPIESIGWAVGAGRSEYDAMAAINAALLPETIVFVLITIAAFCAALVCSRKISTSIGQLRDHALALGRGEPQNPVTMSGTAELDDLANAFNKMAQDTLSRESELRRSRDELDLRVQERTAELSTTIARLKQLNEELQDFAFIASHDLQEPLRKIQTFGNLLVGKHKESLNPEGQDYMERVIKGANRMSELLRSLRDYSRTGTSLLNFKPASLAQVAKDAAGDLELLINEVKGSVEINELPTVDADAKLLRQFFQILIENSIKYRKESEPPVVKIYGNIAGSVCQVMIEDNGIGFDECYCQQIFKPFERLHGKNTPYSGTGMGLAICRKIVNRHGGEITVRSIPDQGTTFIVSLPIEQEKRA